MIELLLIVAIVLSHLFAFGLGYAAAAKTILLRQNDHKADGIRGEMNHPRTWRLSPSDINEIDDWDELESKIED